MAEDAQECKDCNGKGYFDRNHLGKTPTSCQTCEGDGYKYRTGPYRLADGEWSDGVDRVECIKLRRPPNKRWQVYQCATDYWEAYAESDGRQLDEIESFDTHTEAIAYADTQARGK
ncbi:MAG: hypothetical protein ACTH2A_06695 [Glutamicibacter ardleyensis]